MSYAELMEIIAQNPRTRAEVIARIEAAVAEAYARTNARNEKTMLADGCSEEAIDFVREHNEALLRPSILRAIQMLGLNLVDGPERKQ